MSEAKKGPLFSVITITKDNLAGLRRTYASIAAQDFADYEWIIIDGGSADGSLEFLKNDTAAIKIKSIISRPDLGIYDAMNRGLKEIKGTYIIFMNAGDCFAGNSVLSLIAPYTEKEPDFLYGDTLEGTPPVIKEARRYKDLPWGMFTHHQAMIYAARIIKDYDLAYTLRYEIAGDYDFTARFLQKAKSLKRIPQPICIFEDGGISQQKAITGRKEQFMVREELGISAPPMNAIIYLVQSAAWTLKTKMPFIYYPLRKKILSFVDAKQEKKKPKKGNKK